MEFLSRGRLPLVGCAAILVVSGGGALLGSLTWGLGLGLLSACTLYLAHFFSTQRAIRALLPAVRDLVHGTPAPTIEIEVPGELGALSQALGELGQRILRQLAKLQEDTAHFDGILSNMAEGVIALDKHGRVTTVNPTAQRLFGVEPSWSKGRPLLEIIRNGELNRLAHAVLTSGGSHQQEISCFSPEERVFQVHAGPLLIDGMVQGALLVLHDITDLKRLERMRRDFVANVSHELRTPLAAIEGFTETLLEGALDDPSHRREFVQTVQVHAGHLRRLIDDLLDLSAIESGQRLPVRQRTDLSKVIQEVVKTLQPAAAARSVTIHTIVPSDCMLESDPQQLRQVFVNLIDNAVKFNREGGTIEVSATCRGDSLSVDVKDTGLGILEQDLPRVFERFYRVDKARSRDLGGTGLGLAIVKHTVEALGGSVSLTSIQGQGSTFSVTLPLE